ncbi:MAG: ribosomal L7Ae/L30e/S12e/Gadd45 family protein [Nanoarchaeota archaeon]|nr:ribosomal L7Ae/L30e/S12e/Gadd45 family protein [Nanoarchaeota archaeon]MBU1597628.1 ribosomal L7Ae/L30e/S12e/Gadd45 family protein [Nanoarchaeota archaeon]MBU2441385.1 ribosomal L7Ae/L30e/S12e/Gadd45 family protein [Nanoarchaeota archaeon]
MNDRITDRVIEMSVDEIKKLIKTENLVIGADRVLKALRNNEVVKVFLSSNAAEGLAEDVNYYASVAKIDVEQLDIPNDELGVVCKKPFSISCLGLKKIVEKKKF